jgi:hypothetical protein
LQALDFFLKPCANSPDWPQTHSVAQAGFKLYPFCLSLLSEVLDSHVCVIMPSSGFSSFFWREYWGLNSRLCTCEACTLPFQPCLQPLAFLKEAKDLGVLGLWGGAILFV